jgi:hypothetical protein
MPKYTVCTPVKHDGKKYAVGASIDLTKAEFEALPDGTVEQPRADDSVNRKAAEKAEAERKAAEKAEAELKRRADAEAARKAQEEADAAEKAEADRLAAAQAEAARLAAEQEAAGNGGAQS